MNNSSSYWRYLWVFEDVLKNHLETSRMKRGPTKQTSSERDDSIIKEVDHGFLETEWKLPRHFPDVACRQQRVSMDHFDRGSLLQFHQQALGEGWAQKFLELGWRHERSEIPVLFQVGGRTWLDFSGAGSSFFPLIYCMHAYAGVYYFHYTVQCSLIRTYI